MKNTLLFALIISICFPVLSQNMLEERKSLSANYVSSPIDSLIESASAMITKTEKMIAKGRDNFDEVEYAENLDSVNLAIAMLDQVVARKPKNAMAWYWRGKAKINIDGDKEALKDFEQAAILKSKNYEFDFQKAECKFRLHDLQGAILDYSSSLTKSPKKGCKNCHFIYYKRGICYSLTEQKELALADLDAAVSMSTRNGEYLYARGTTKIELGDKYGGCVDIDQSGMLDRIDSKQAEQIRKYCK